MSETDVQSIEHTLSELELRIQARLGRWAFTIIGSCIGIALMGASQWFPTLSRIEKLETWKLERAVGIDGYNQFREVLEGRLSKIEATQMRQSEDIKEILQLLRRP
jgi:hypothetical protein